jgi:hypothetical protein
MPGDYGEVTFPIDAVHLSGNQPGAHGGQVIAISAQAVTFRILLL